jgi:hypothetical protein
MRQIVPFQSSDHLKLSFSFNHLLRILNLSFILLFKHFQLLDNLEFKIILFHLLTLNDHLGKHLESFISRGSEEF